MQYSLDPHQTKSAVLESLERNPRLYVEENFIDRMKALDVLEFQMLDEMELETDSRAVDAEPSPFMRRAEAIQLKLEAANEGLFSRLLANIRSGDRATLKRYLRKAEQEIAPQTSDDEVDYDEMDMLINGLLEVPVVPSEPDARDAGIMFFQPTQTRIILKIIDLLQLQADDIFYDLGSGIGHVPILVNLLTDVRTKGIELEASYVRYSEACLEKLAVADVQFIQADAREANYDNGTVFYMYTPFKGEVLQQVLNRLEAQAQRRPIRICAYGPCTAHVRKQQWLQAVYQAGKKETDLGIFHSL